MLPFGLFRRILYSFSTLEALLHLSINPQHLARFVDFARHGFAAMVLQRLFGRKCAEAPVAMNGYLVPPINVLPIVSQLVKLEMA